MRTKAEILEWEGRWALPAAISTLVGVALVIASAFVIGDVSGDGDAEVLRSAYEHSSSITFSSLLQGAGFLFLVLPLVYLFKAVAARSPKVRYQLIGVIVAAPLFLAGAAVFSAIATNEAADEYAAGTVEPGIATPAAAGDCQTELNDLGAEEFGDRYAGGSEAAQLKDCTTTRVADETATDAIAEASTRGIATGLGFGGRLGLAFAMVYCCMHAMRVGLFTRFWGSLGMALGVAALLLLVQFTMIWFIYLGLLLLGRVPGGRPPAWAAGEAIPWPTPGEQAAAKLEPDGDGDAAELDFPDEDPDSNGSAGPSDPSEPRKRKQRD